MFSDNFDSENGGTGELDYDAFTHWNVIDGTVDLSGNGINEFFPWFGAYIDLDGSTRQAGILETKQTFDFAPGIYELKFDLAGSHRGSIEQVTVTLGAIHSEVITVEESAPFTTFTRTIQVLSPTSGTLSFHNAGGDNIGVYLDNVVLSTVDPATTPEPASLIGLLVFGGVGSLSKRRFQ